LYNIFLGPKGVQTNPRNPPVTAIRQRQTAKTDNVAEKHEIRREPCCKRDRQ